ncbi:MAG: RHS repeat-associated core domain-containing protein [Armatimonadota bacterium]
MRVLLTPNGVPTDLYHYDSWGNPIPTSTETTRQPFRWNGAYGYEYVAFTGLYHVGAREYDPKTRRWLQPDPIDAAGGHPNIYLYCANDPLNNFDDGSEWFKKTEEGLWVGPFLFNAEVVVEVFKTG